MVKTGEIGIWSAQLRSGDPPEIADAATELEALGFDTIWVPGRGPADLEQSLRVLLDATERMTIAIRDRQHLDAPAAGNGGAPRRGSPRTSPAASCSASA